MKDEIAEINPTRCQKIQLRKCLRKEAEKTDGKGERTRRTPTFVGPWSQKEGNSGREAGSREGLEAGPRVGSQDRGPQGTAGAAEPGHRTCRGAPGRTGGLTCRAGTPRGFECHEGPQTPRGRLGDSAGVPAALQREGTGSVVEHPPTRGSSLSPAEINTEQNGVTGPETPGSVLAAAPFPGVESAAVSPDR